MPDGRKNWKCWHVFDHHRYQDEIFRRGFGSSKIARMIIVDQLLSELTRAFTVAIALWGALAPRCGHCSCRCPQCPEQTCTPSLSCPRGDLGAQISAFPVRSITVSAAASLLSLACSWDLCRLCSWSSCYCCSRTGYLARSPGCLRWTRSQVSLHLRRPFSLLGECRGWRGLRQPR